MSDTFHRFLILDTRTVEDENFARLNEQYLRSSRFARNWSCILIEYRQLNAQNYRIQQYITRFSFQAGAACKIFDCKQACTLSKLYILTLILNTCLEVSKLFQYVIQWFIGLLNFISVNTRTDHLDQLLIYK